MLATRAPHRGVPVGVGSGVGVLVVVDDADDVNGGVLVSVKVPVALGENVAVSEVEALPEAVREQEPLAVVLVEGVGTDVPVELGEPVPVALWLAVHHESCHLVYRQYFISLYTNDKYSYLSVKTSRQD